MQREADGYPVCVGPIAVHRLMRRTRRHLAGLLAVLALATVVTVHHSDMPMDGMSGMQHDSGSAVTMTVCVGAFVALGAAVAAVTVGNLRLGRWRALSVLAPEQLLWSDGPRASTRAGPPGLPLLSIWRI